MRANRGGHTLKTGKIGRVNCIRQQVCMPGEKMRIDLNGKVRLESLRERDSMRINAHLAIFMTPLRWLWSDFPQYLREGPDTAVTPPTGSFGDWSVYGVGSYGAVNQNMLLYFRDSYLKVVNEWYKWPENSDYVPGDIGDHGVKAVPLAKTWSRTRQSVLPDDTGDYQVASATVLDVKSLATVQARYRAAMKRDRLSFNRWMELIKQTWNGDGSREVDQVPILIDQTQIGVNPREIPATDGASLGQWQSLFDFGINHTVPGVVAPEHCILSYMLTIRFAPTIEGHSPLAQEDVNWWELVGDPEWIANEQPQEVFQNEIIQENGSASLGYLPAGWQWRADHDVVGKSVDIRDSFPYSLAPTSFAQTKDASRVKSAFRSQALDDYMADIYIKESSNLPIGDAMDSYMSGMADDQEVKVKTQSTEFPPGGKSL